MNAISLLKLAASGIQDERLTKPQPSLDSIKPVIPKRGRYTLRWERLDFQSTPQFNQQATIEIPVKGHLLRRLYLVSTLPDIYRPQKLAQQEAAASSDDFAGPYFNWTNSAGHALVQEANITIGGTTIDRLDSRLLEVLDEFNTPLEKLETVNKLLLRNMTNYGATSWLDEQDQGPRQVCVPLPFWFSRDPALALPVDAINADKIQLNIQFRALAGIYYTDSRTPDGTGLWPMQGSKFYKVDFSSSGAPAPPGFENTTYPVLPLTTTMPSSFSLGETYIMAQYIYLDKYEANRFRIADIEVPIVQHYALPPETISDGTRVQVPINVPNPVRSLYWMAQKPAAAALNAHFNANNNIAGINLWPIAFPVPKVIPSWQEIDLEPFAGFAIEYEGYERYKTTSPQLFRSILPAQTHTKTPYINKYYYTASFSDESEPISEPKGEANLDKISRRWFNADMAIRGDYNVHVWAETFNVLKIYGGRAGLLFSY